jgi:hypothetical protein
MSILPLRAQARGVLGDDSVDVLHRRVRQRLRHGRGHSKEKTRRTRQGVRNTPGLHQDLVRLPVLMLLVILEPVVAFVLGGLALAGILTTIFFKLIEAPHFPAWTMPCLSIGFGLALVVYEATIRLLSNPRSTPVDSATC